MIRRQEMAGSDWRCVSTPIALDYCRILEIGKARPIRPSLADRQGLKIACQGFQNFRKPLSGCRIIENSVLSDAELMVFL